MKMIQYQYTLCFHAPAFLGNAEQSGQWRTPPFKAQLRQWWRVAYAASKRFSIDTEAMRQAEGMLFGNAWLKDNFSKSLVRIRLEKWDSGRLKSWDGLEQAKIDHPEAERSGRKVGPHAYLAYGPLDGRGGTQFQKKGNAAIQAGEQTTLSLACPEEHAMQITQALSLMDLFGTAGGRSRNGWGSYSLTPAGDAPALSAPLTVRPWRDALKLDWPHVVGSDEQGALIWQTGPFVDWMALLRQLAIIKIGLRRQFRFPHAQPDGEIHDRHWLSYPVTTHKVRAWDKNNARLPNSLRFKVRPTGDGQVVGVIFHMPCLPPPAFSPDARAIEAVWRKVHAFLDAPEQHLTRILA